MAPENWSQFDSIMEDKPTTGNFCALYWFEAFWPLDNDSKHIYSLKYEIFDNKK